MSDLTISFCGVKFKNPILTASGTFGYGIEYKDLVNLNKLGGIVFKSVTVKPLLGNPQPRIFELPYGLVNSIGLENKGVDWLLKDLLPKVRDLETELIPSIYGFSFSEYIELLKRLSEIERFRFIELNISCPNVESEIHKLERDLKIFTHFVNEVRKATSKKLIMKFSPLLFNIVDFVRVARDNGIDAVSLINTIPVVTFDWRTRKSNICRISGGLSGPALKPIAQKLCMDIYREIDIPIIGIGGIFQIDDVMEYLACGATLVQIGTANFIKPNISEECVRELENIVKQENIPSIEKFIGCYVWGNKELTYLTINTDGASLGNPGPASSAYIFTDQNNNLVLQRAFSLGITTNNVAEYTALLYALKFLSERTQFLTHLKSVNILSDSQLMIRQLKGEYKIKDENLKKLNEEIKKYIATLGKPINFTYIDRQKNVHADSLCRKELRRVAYANYTI